MNIAKEHWHYLIWDELNKQLFANSLNKDHFTEDGKINHQEVFFQIKEGEVIELKPKELDAYQDTYYVKMQKGNINYILPKKYVKHLPVIPKETIDVRLKKSETQVWKFITDIDSVTTPKRQYFDFRTTIDMFNPMNNSNEYHWRLMKMIAFTKGIKLAVCGEVGAGKNANLTVMRKIRNNVAPKIKNVTRAMLWRLMFYNDQLNLDEFTTWDNQYVKDIEDVAAEFGDEAPDVDKFSLDSKKELLNIDNLNRKSLMFTFNPPSDYNQTTFRSKFKNYDKIKDRFPILLIKGKVLDSVPQPSPQEAKQIVRDNFQELCKIVANDAFWVDNVHLALKGFDRSLVPFERRHLSNIGRLIDTIEGYCLNQEEFNIYMMMLDKMVKDFEKLEERGWEEVFNNA